MSNPPAWDRDDVDATVKSGDNYREASHKGNGATRRNGSSRHKPDSRQQAVNDAHQSLQSLLNPQTPDGHPRIISSSGIVHRSHGRVVGPAAERRTLGGPSSGYSPVVRTGIGPASSAGLKCCFLSACCPRHVRGSGRKRKPGGNPFAFPTPASAGTLRALRRAWLSVSKQAGLFLDEPGAQGLSAAPEKRTASSWVSRHTTFVVILALVAVLAVAGGFKVFSAHSDINHDLAASQAFNGNDVDETGYNDTAKNADGSDFQLALPRTQVNNSAPGGQSNANALPPDVTHYTVVQGDTIDSIASKYNVMAETVLGSNGIFDSQENLAPGRVLVIPPVDGMYYVAQKGDTADTVAHRFQVEPDAVTSYKRNVVNPDGTINEGQALVVPGGMMPERDTVLTYTVRSGDTLRSIAARFQIDVPTMINSNNIPDPDSLQPGSQLRVLPVPGMEYKVKKGDTITTIANRLGVTPQMILDYQPNHLTVDSKLQIDQVMMVPGGDPSVAAAADTVATAATIAATAAIAVKRAPPVIISL